jgi:hypothetical protein
MDPDVSGGIRSGFTAINGGPMYSADETKQWLLEQIPLRVTAGILGSEICDEWAGSEDSPDSRVGLRSACLQDASYLGRLAAVRWLIEFVGIQEVKDRNQGPIPRPSRAAKAVLFDGVSDDFGLSMLPGGRLFTPEHEDAVLLAKAWKACADATSHPIRNDNHVTISASTLTAVMKIIIRHLDATVYARAGFTIREAVGMQVDARFRQA